MKKLFLFAALAVAACFSACNAGSGSANSDRDGFDTIFSQAKLDTLSELLAEVAGSQNNEQFKQAIVKEPYLSKEAFVKGLRYVANADTATAFTYGMYTAFNLNNQFKQWEATGLKVDRSKFVAYFVKYFMADSINNVQLMASQDQANALSHELREAERLFKMAQIQNSPESQENIAKGRAYIDSMATADSNVKVLASGVAYRIDQVGEGANVGQNDRVKMQYVMRQLNGQIVDQTTPETLRVTPVSSRVPGLREAMGKMQQGTKAVVVVPGSQAYQENMNGRYGLGPNETLVYEVEIVELIPADSKE